MSHFHYGISPKKGDSPKFGERPLTSINKIRRPLTSLRQDSNPYIPSTNRTISRSPPQKPKPSIIGPARNAELFDNMIHSLRTQPLYLAIECCLKRLLFLDQAVVWFSIQNSLYSETKNQTITCDKGIVGHCFTTQTVVNAGTPSESKCYDEAVDKYDGSALYFPLILEEGNCAAVCQCNRFLPFVEEDIQSINYFTAKFAQYAHLLLLPTPETREMVDVVSHASDIDGIIDGVIHFLKKNCVAKTVDFYKHEGLTYFKFTNGEFSEIEPRGLIFEPISTLAVFNQPNISLVEGYDPEVDGNGSLCVVPTKVGPTTLAIVMIGDSPFTNQMVTQVERLLPVVVKPIASSHEKGVGFAARLKALLEIAEKISGVLDIDSLIPMIMEKACTLLQTERCSFFLVDHEREELISRFHGGLDKKICIPLKSGLAGHTAVTGEILNITDPYSDSRFDKSIDKLTGFVTKNILTVPVYNHRGEIAGVTEMINKKEGPQFDDEDIKMLVAFNVFCGISLDNSRLYQASIDLTRQLRGFVEMSSALNSKQTIREIVGEILKNGRTAISAQRATLFTVDPKGAISSFLNSGSTSKYGSKFAKFAVDKKKPHIFTQHEIDSILSVKDEVEKPRDEEEEEYVKKVEKIKPDVNICALPILSADYRLLGILEVESHTTILKEDMKLLECFAAFTSFSLDKARLEDIAKFGTIEAEQAKYITDEEREQYSIPEALQIEDDSLFAIGFNAALYEGVDYFKVLWKIFNEFNLLSEFGISNEKFFHFLTAISQTYNPVPYHNWRHAVDVTQFVAYQVKLSNLDRVLSKNELLGLFIAAICHDANHDGFSNAFNEKAQTPLGILFKNQSVMETHHCSVAIRILSMEDCNLFDKLQPNEYKAIWSQIINLILATDMSKHHDIIQETTSLIDSGRFVLKEQKLLAMKLILKCADISNVSRPFELADQWCDLLCEEFFRQGDLEKTEGMEYTSPLNDREHLDKPKSQIGFYNFVCLPLFQTAAKVIPGLDVNVEQIESNLAKWKAVSAPVEEKKVPALQPIDVLDEI